MSRYDDLKGNLQAIYEAALDERRALQSKLEEVNKEIDFLSPFCGGVAPAAVSAKDNYTVEGLKAVEASKVSGKRKGAKAAKAAKADKAVKAAKADKAADSKANGKKERIKVERLRGLVMQCLNDAYPNSLSASEIIDKIVEQGLPNTTSFRTRVYGKLGDWMKEGILERSNRGVYKIVKKDDNK